MERELRDLVARSNLSVAHAAALVQIEAAHGAVEQARGRLDELVGTGLGTMRPDMLYLWALTLLARDCVVLRAAGHAPRVYQALAPYAGRAAVAAGAVMCSGSTDFYLAGLAALTGDTAAADRHYRAAASCHRRLGARPMLAHTLHEHARLLDPSAASAALAEARAIAADCGMTKLLAALDQAEQPRKPGAPHPAARGRFLARRLRGRRHPGTGQPGPALPGPAHPPPRPGAGRPGPGPARRRHRPGRRDSRRRPARRVRNRGRRDPRPAGPGRLPAAPHRPRRGTRRSRGVARHRAGQPPARRERLPGPRARRRDRARRQATAPRRGIRTRPAQRHPRHQVRDRQDPRPRPGRRRPPRPVRPDRHPLLLLPAGPPGLSTTCARTPCVSACSAPWTSSSTTSRSLRSTRPGPNPCSPTCCSTGTRRSRGSAWRSCSGPGRARARRRRTCVRSCTRCAARCRTRTG